MADALKFIRRPRGGGIIKAFLWKVLGALFTVYYTRLITVAMSEHEAGEFFYLFACIAVTATVARYGTDVSLIKRLAEFKLREEPGATARFCFGTINAIHRNSIVFTLVVVVALGLAAGLSEVSALLMLGAVVAINTYTPASHVIRTVGRSEDGFLYLAFLPPAIFSLIIVFIQPVNMLDALSGYFMACVAVGLVTFFAAVRLLELRQVSDVFAAYRQRINFDSVDFRLFFISLGQLVFAWGGVIALKLHSLDGDIAQFAVCTRIAGLLLFIQTGINVFAAPLLSTAIAANNMQKAFAVLRKVWLLSAILGVGLFIVLMAFGEEVLSIFGAGYSNALPILLVLCLGQCVNICTGPVTLFLSLRGDDRFVAANFGVFAAGCILSLLFAPIYFGVLVVALTIAISIAGQNICSTIRLLRQL